jgi:hypothetical protein
LACWVAAARSGAIQSLSGHIGSWWALNQNPVRCESSQSINDPFFAIKGTRTRFESCRTIHRAGTTILGVSKAIELMALRLTCCDCSP